MAVPSPSRPSTRAQIRAWLDHARKVLLDPATFSILFIVLLFNAVIRIQAVQDAFPILEKSELRFHRFLFSLSPREIAPKWVRVVPIDDGLHARLGDPTDRAYLADLISNAVKGDAAAVVLDFKLLAPLGESPGHDDQGRALADQKFIRSINQAAVAGVPVVVSIWLDKQGSAFVRRPDFFLDEQLALAKRDGRCDPTTFVPGSAHDPSRHSACAWLGDINLPSDMRQVPLATPVKGSGEPMNSLALSAVDAYEFALDRRPKLRSNPRIADSILEGDFVYGSFIPEAQFQTISPENLQGGVPQALADSRGRILIIGGNWHKDLGNGELEDAHDTPAGYMAGVFIHANYIEALLDERFTREVPLWAALLFDLIGGAALYLLFHRAKGWLAQLLVLVVPAALLVISYVLFTNLNYYLDFIFPLAACFVHLGKEYVEDYVHLRSNRTSPGAHAHRD